MGYAFISYSTKNQASADAIRELFNKYNIDTWMAPYDIPAGSKYAAVITKAIRDCSCFVLLLSNDSQASEAVDSEVELAALTFKKSIITVELEKVTLNDAFTFYIHNKQIIAVHELDEDSYEVKQVLNAVRVYVGNNDCGIENKITREMKIETVHDNNISQKGFFRKLTNAMRKKGESDSQLETFEDLTPKKNESEKTNLVFGKSPEYLVGKRIDGRYVIKEMLCDDKNGVVTYFAQDEVAKTWMHNRNIVMYFISDTYRKQWNEDGLSDKQIKKEVYGLLHISKEKICKLEIGERSIYLISDEEYLKYNTYEELLNKYAGNEEV